MDTFNLLVKKKQSQKQSWKPIASLHQRLVPKEINVLKRLRRNRRGQFAIIAALLIATLTLSLALTIHQTNLHRQQLRYQPVNELLLGVTSDLDRTLTHALSVFTNATLFNSPTDIATQFILTWKEVVLTSFAPLDLKLKLNELETVPQIRLFAISWDQPVSFSTASVGYSIDVNGYGFKGWTGRAAKYVCLEIIPDSISSPQQGQTTLKFQLTQNATNENKRIPIPNLTSDLVRGGSYEPGVFRRYPLAYSLSYLGNGIYNVTLNDEINSATSGVSLTVTTPDEGISVRASFYRNVNVTLNTREENGPSTNLGRIWFRDGWYFDGSFDTSIEVPVTLPSQPYSLQFQPDAGYEFVRWETTPSITVHDPLQFSTGVEIEDSGTITAVYTAGTTIPPDQACNVWLDSRDYDNSTLHKGEISLNSTQSYSLPYNATNLATGFYQVEYWPENASYTFYSWELSGAAAMASSTPGQSTLISIYGDANITAVYVFTPDNPPPPPPPPPPPNGEWNSLYFDDKQTLVPGYMWSGHDGHDETHSSTGHMKQSTLLSTPILTPRIECAQKINITMFITPVPPESVKSVEIALGFIFNQQYYSIGNYTFNINIAQTIYQTTFDIDSIELVPGQGTRIIPAGSTMQLTCTVNFLIKNGFNFIYHGIDNPSRIDLF